MYEDLLNDYCKGCQKLNDDGSCIYPDRLAKTAMARGGHLGCAYSPCERRYYMDSLPVSRRRAGQQKQKKR